MTHVLQPVAHATTCQHLVSEQSYCSNPIAQSRRCCEADTALVGPIAEGRKIPNGGVSLV